MLIKTNSCNEKESMASIPQQRPRDLLKIWYWSYRESIEEFFCEIAPLMDIRIDNLNILSSVSNNIVYKTIIYVLRCEPEFAAGIESQRIIEKQAQTMMCNWIKTANTGCKNSQRENCKTIAQKLFDLTKNGMIKRMTVGEGKQRLSAALRMREWRERENVGIRSKKSQIPRISFKDVDDVAALIASANSRDLKEIVHQSR
ncbi:hypothetical protein FO519_009438 [Halicephalobus sp. NKZ332]|nr:hypothetical protein FO519_009438 [Halicephalobus sp. NKZ332]